MKVSALLQVPIVDADQTASQKTSLIQYWRKPQVVKHNLMTLFCRLMAGKQVVADIRTKSMSYKGTSP